MAAAWSESRRKALRNDLWIHNESLFHFRRAICSSGIRSARLGKGVGNIGQFAECNASQCFGSNFIAAKSASILDTVQALSRRTSAVMQETFFHGINLVPCSAALLTSSLRSVEHSFKSLKTSTGRSLPKPFDEVRGRPGASTPLQESPNGRGSVGRLYTGASQILEALDPSPLLQNDGSSGAGKATEALHQHPCTHQRKVTACRRPRIEQHEQRARTSAGTAGRMSLELGIRTKCLSSDSFTGRQIRPNSLQGLGNLTFGKVPKTPQAMWLKTLAAAAKMWRAEKCTSRGALPIFAGDSASKAFLAYTDLTCKLKLGRAHEGT